MSTFLLVFLIVSIATCTAYYLGYLEPFIKQINEKLNKKEVKEVKEDKEVKENKEEKEDKENKEVKEN